MEKKTHGDEIQKELEVISSRLNALEASTSDKQQKALLGIIKLLVENQKHFIKESDHFRKAMDLLTLQIFELEKK